MTIDGSTTDYPAGFGTFLPVGRLESDLFVGGVPDSQSDLLHFGLPRNGFKGYLDHMRINGRALDFSENVESQAVSFEIEDRELHGENGNEYCFTGASYAQFGEHTNHIILHEQMKHFVCCVYVNHAFVYNIACNDTLLW